MLSQIKKRNEGFTIIEVLIVLAIAGLILLIVFLAVPALQRNSRNTQMKNSAAAVLGAVSEYTNNNNGTLPGDGDITVDTDTGTVTVGDSDHAQATAKVQAGYSVSTGATMPTSVGTIVINLGHKCDGNSFAAASSPRSFAAGYVVETSGSGTAKQCQES